MTTFHQPSVVMVKARCRRCRALVGLLWNDDGPLRWEHRESECEHKPELPNPELLALDSQRVGADAATIAVPLR